MNKNETQTEEVDEKFIVNSLNGFLKFLNLPNEKIELSAKLKAMKIEAGKSQIKH